MTNKIKAGLVAALMLLGASGMAEAAQPDDKGKPEDVHHPVEECDGTFIKDQPPFDGLSVTVAYTGNMWIKISNEHVFVPTVTKGEVYTPDTLSSWPLNKNDKPQAISHVDYCVEGEVPPTEVTPSYPFVVPPTCDEDGYIQVPEQTVGYTWGLQGSTYVVTPDDGYVFPEGTVTVWPIPDVNLDAAEVEGCDTPPTTEPPVTTVPPVTVPETPVTTPPTTTEPPLVVCIDTFENDDISGCFEVPPTVPPTPPTSPQALPETGSEPYPAILGLIFLMSGWGLLWIRKRGNLTL